MTVFVVGSINLDERYTAARIPAPGETVTADSRAASLGGKGANQAVAVAAAGERAILVAAVGDDTAGRRTTDELTAAGVATDHVHVDGDADTGRALVMVDGDGENAIIVVPGANHRLSASQVRDALRHLSATDVVVMQSEVTAAANHAAAAAAREAGARSLWNAAPSPRTADEIVAADIVVVNAHELRDIARLLGIDQRAGTGDADDADPTALVVAVARELDATLVCTRGAEGIVHSIRGEAAARTPSLRVDVVDTTGAGDATVGYLAASLDLPLADALRLAAVAGALTVTRPGASASIAQAADVRRALRTPHERTPA